MSWKTTLYDYVHHKNQMDMDYSVEPLLPFVTDTQFLQEQIKRLARTAHSDQDRRYFPVKNETRLTIVQSSVQQHQVTADIRLKRNSVGAIGNTELEEQRVETERITLEQFDEKWHITRIELVGVENSFPINTPNHGSSAEMEAGEPYVNRGIRLPSLPYLNYDVVPYLESSGRRFSYNRAQAVEYAETWWDKANPSYIEFEVDCSSFVSQCLFAGGAPMNYTGKRDLGWWYKGKYNGQEHWSFSWAVAHSLQGYMLNSRTGLHAEIVDHADRLQLGDVISYDWEGGGRFSHSAIVTAKDANGMPLMNAHTINSRHRYWAYKDSPAWTERTIYRFLHITELR
ncbi:MULTISPECIES: amidase domain-containing protein [unclassified Paenibacillus]|uniref:amidase domain-containing protein n=1 Tax=unclassified Paenibacillus TaxID=185978 RepID=UPI00363D3F96